MGIPFYYASLTKSHSGIIRPVKDKLQTDIVCFDFNSLIHQYLVDTDPLHSVLSALEKILNTICQGKIVYIALDGLVPYAKIVQQRYRRMAIKEEGVFDRNQISPGTPYMRELEQGIRSKFPDIIVSGTDEPGEGEHKMIQYLKSVDPLMRKNIVVYGMDADLILIFLHNHRLASEILLLRENGEEFNTLNIQNLLTQLPLPINQYIPLSILCFGNDFMPNIGIFSLREGGYERALEYYSACGSPDLNTEDGRAIFIDYSTDREMTVLKEKITRRKRPEEKSLFGSSPANFIKRYRLIILEGVENIEPVVDAFWKTFHWTLEYFTTSKPVDWDWYYPYADAPLLSDLVEFQESEKLSSSPLTFSVTKQLQLILPKKSLRTAKKLVKFLDERYTETRNPWMKKFDWEMKPMISLPWNPKNFQISVVPI